MSACPLYEAHTKGDQPPYNGEYFVGHGIVTEV